MRARGFLLALLLLQAACGGGGGGSPPVVQPPPPVATVTIYYLRADPSYDGWGLHLWGDAISGSVATGWASPRLPDRIENDIAVFEIPLVDSAAALNFIAHNGDLKSPVHDMSFVPRTFGFDVWLVQDSVASQNGNIGTPYASLAAAQAALAALGDASASWTCRRWRPLRRIRGCLPTGAIPPRSSKFTCVATRTRMATGWEICKG